jgi:hypothetical protein
MVLIQLNHYVRLTMTTHSNWRLELVLRMHRFDADPDPAFHFKADADSSFHTDADPDPTTKQICMYSRFCFFLKCGTRGKQTIEKK